MTWPRNWIPRMGSVPRAGAAPTGHGSQHFVAAVGPEPVRDPTLSWCPNSTFGVQGLCVLWEVLSEQGVAGVRSRAQETSAPAL